MKTRKRILTGGLSAIDFVRCLYCGMSLLAILILAEAPAWMLLAALANFAVSAHLVNKVKFPDK